MSYYITIDIGGTYIKYGLLNENEEIVHADKTRTPINHNQAIVRKVIRIVETFFEKHTIKGIGISTAGIVDRAQGEIIYAGPTILNYKGTNFKAALSKFSVPVSVANDVDCALLGEIWRAHIPSDEATYCLTLGTGIGGAFFHHRLQSGAHLQGNSLGYLLYDPHTKTNYEMRAATTALNESITRAFGPGLSTAAFFERAKAGERKAIAILHDWSKEVAAGIAQIILLIDPKRIIIGGGISAQGDFLLEVIRKHVEVFLPENLLKTELMIATEQNNASLFGAVYPFFENKTQKEK